MYSIIDFTDKMANKLNLNEEIWAVSIFSFDRLLIFSQTSSIILHRFWINCMLEENTEKNNLLATAAVFLAAKIKQKSLDLKIVHCMFKDLSEVQSNFSNEFEFFNDQLVKFEMDLLIYNNFDFDIVLPFRILENCQKIIRHK